MSGGARTSLALLVLGAGCAVGPDYSRPATSVPTAFKEAPPGWKPAQPADDVRRGAWWELFADPALNALERQIDVDNQTLAAAEAQFRQARALVGYNRAGYVPSVSGGVSAQRIRQSQNRALFVPGAKVNYNDVLIPVDVSYEFDVWGRIRRSVEAARADAQASAADLESVRLSLHAELALDYYALRTTDAEVQLLRATVAAFERALQLTQERHRGGVASAADVAQAETQLALTRAQAIDLEVARSQEEHALAVLVGRPPGSFAVAAADAPPAAPPPLASVGLPSELLERRPDIAAEERRMAAANARIGVARAAYFPSLTLIASGGLQSDTVTNLLSLPSTLFALGLSAMVTVFDGGRRRAVGEQAQAAYDQTVAGYRQTVLAAFAEVEDNLAALRVLEEEAKLQDAAVASAERSLALSTNRYKGGVVTYLEVLTAQNTALSAQRTGVGILRRRLAATVLLVKALGGGWQASALARAQR